MADIFNDRIPDAVGSQPDGTLNFLNLIQKQLNLSTTASDSSSTRISLEDGSYLLVPNDIFPQHQQSSSKETFTAKDSKPSSQVPDISELMRDLLERFESSNSGARGSDRGSSGGDNYHQVLYESIVAILKYLDCLEEQPGREGPRGEKGDKGDRGEKGDKGDPGANGEKGDKGDPGARGEKGDKGDPGARGEKGDKGDPGARGEKGDKGDPGARGEKGDKGDPGANGEKGDKGDPGANGEKGDKGDPGARGEKGDKGDRGEAGKDGKDADKGPALYGLVKGNPNARPPVPDRYVELPVFGYDKTEDGTSYANIYKFKGTEGIYYKTPDGKFHKLPLTFSDINDGGDRGNESVIGFKEPANAVKG